MEPVNQPTQPRKVSDEDQRRLDAFKTFLLSNRANELHEVFLEIYFDFSQLVTKKTEYLNDYTSGNLFYLQSFIEILK